MNKYTLTLLTLVIFSLAGWAQSEPATFTGTDITTTGQVQLQQQDGQPVVTLSSDFQTQEGPDLHVYLAADTSATDYTDLGALTSQSGEQSYEVPADVDVAAQPMVLIYCQEFSHLFGYAKLKNPVTVSN